ncbi:prepilin-type N-terminal cleavage/methylation domain-containing protein [Halalkalibacter kiskunsagensis]|uniref:Prepilin-type N-terminal cleavage/methylation domain-containing protein n=1 Tax=Halalkalibacter kiskunsagensis TaxID=1548599 RepID=A0ABV6KCI5_9BACI
MNGVCWPLDKKGFTLIEMLIVLTLFFIIVSIFPVLLKTVSNGSHVQTVSSQQVTTFFNHLAHDVREAVKVEVVDNGVVITKSNGDKFRVEMLSSNQIRRTRNGEGMFSFLNKLHYFLVLLHSR